MYANNRRFSDDFIAKIYRDVVAESGGIKEAVQWVRDQFLSSEQLIKEHWQKNFSDLIDYQPASPFFWSSMYYLMHQYNQAGRTEDVDAYELREQMIRQERVSAQRRILERIWNNS